MTGPREHIRQHKDRTGEGLSFTTFFIACLARAAPGFQPWRRLVADTTGEYPAYDSTISE